ncbi:heme ABC exporter ATP-binding protein CcmA [Sphingomicrobium marinum]|uniref:heme ABC exporter ATP-binding protein CcmA n=1 Tax=Sphingomicrobium marinum TaxID=1227950 RepID=UPI00223F336B|nr:heme ABC exporter ATP-binding protein CcmA [Sphingomicrobium marinum]
MSALVRLDGVTLRRGGRLLFEDFDLTVSQGEAVVLTGPNGRGKSSLIRLVAGLLEPSAGKVHASPAALADERLALDGERTLEAAIKFWTDFDDGDDGAASSALNRVGLMDLAHVPVRFLSTGQRQRARLARVMASPSPLWLLDEPFSGLDAAGQKQLCEEIDFHLSTKGAVLAASHVSLGPNWREVAL